MTCTYSHACPFPVVEGSDTCRQHAIALTRGEFRMKSWGANDGRSAPPVVPHRAPSVRSNFLDEGGRRERMLSLRRSGATLQCVAKELGCSISLVHRAERAHAI